MKGENEVSWTLSLKDNEGNIWRVKNQRRISLTTCLLSFTLILCSWWCKSGSRRKSDKKGRGNCTTRLDWIFLSKKPTDELSWNDSSDKQKGRKDKWSGETNSDWTKHGEEPEKKCHGIRETNEHLDSLKTRKIWGFSFFSWITEKRVLKPESELSEFCKVFRGLKWCEEWGERQDRGKPTLFSLVCSLYTIVFQARRRQEADNDREETHVFFSFLSHFVVSIGSIEDRSIEEWRRVN